MAPVPSAVSNEHSSQSGDRNEYYIPPTLDSDSIEKFINGDIKIENVAPVEYVGSGEDDAPRSPMRKAHSRDGSLRVNGIKREKGNQSLVLERYPEKDGGHLIGVAPENSISDSLRLNDKMPRARHNRSHELVSGRRAGAGWEQSGYCQSMCLFRGRGC